MTFWEMLQITETELPMPTDLPRTQRDVWKAHYDQPGIYFAWRVEDGLLQYVGRSKTIGIRVYGYSNQEEPHNPPYNEKRPEIYGCLINCVFMPEYETHLAELYYIWKLRPVMNGEVKNYHKKQGANLAAHIEK